MFCSTVFQAPKIRDICLQNVHGTKFCVCTQSRCTTHITTEIHNACSLRRHQLPDSHSYMHTFRCFTCIWIISCFPAVVVFYIIGFSAVQSIGRGTNLMFLAYSMSVQTPPLKLHPVNYSKKQKQNEIPYKIW